MTTGTTIYASSTVGPHHQRAIQAGHRRRRYSCLQLDLCPATFPLSTPQTALTNFDGTPIQGMRGVFTAPVQHGEHMAELSVYVVPGHMPSTIDFSWSLMTPPKLPEPKRHTSRKTFLQIFQRSPLQRLEHPPISNIKSLCVTARDPLRRR